MRRAAPLMACALLFGACTGEDGAASSTVVTATTRDERGLPPEMADAVDEAEAAFLVAFDAARRDDRTPSFAVMELGGCEDRGRQKVPNPYGELELRGGGGSTLEDAVAVRDRLIDAGLRPIESSRYANGLDVSDDRWGVAAEDGDVSVRVLLWSDRPFVVVDAVGRCVPVTEDERIRLNELGPWDLDIGG